MIIATLVVHHGQGIDLVLVLVPHLDVVIAVLARVLDLNLDLLPLVPSFGRLRVPLAPILTIRSVKPTIGSIGFAMMKARTRTIIAIITTGS